MTNLLKSLRKDLTSSSHNFHMASIRYRQIKETICFNLGGFIKMKNLKKLASVGMISVLMLGMVACQGADKKANEAANAKNAAVEEQANANKAKVEANAKEAEANAKADEEQAKEGNNAKANNAKCDNAKADNAKEEKTK